VLGLTSTVAERRGAGIEVTVLLDASGSLGVPAEYVDLMRAAGCRVEFFRPLRRFLTRREQS
jgi:hypothetical protein